MINGRFISCLRFIFDNMRVISLFTLIVALLAGCAVKNSQSSARASERTSVAPLHYQYPGQKSFTVMTWNVEHFVDLYDNPYISNRREDNPRSSMQPRIGIFLEALKKADADIVVLQEFESAAYLRKLINEHLPEMGYQFFADAPSQNWYMNVVLMSKLPLGVLSTYGNVTTPVENYTDSLGRTETQNHLNTRMWSVEVFPSGEYDFILTGLHLKAGRGERNAGMRTGQIRFLKSQFERYLSENSEKNILVVGDLNATPESAEIKLLKRKDSKSKNSFTDPLAETDYTHPADNADKRIDYMLPNHNMVKELEEVEVKYFFSAEKMRKISDHLPVLSKFSNSDQ